MHESDGGSRGCGRRWRRSSSLLACAPAAHAQGFYYKEIRKDERIYVFNIAEEADRFEKSGEMGRGLTRPGAGPNGETVVGDSERALQLFFFKHGISEPVPEPPVPAPAHRVARRQDANHHRPRLPRNLQSRPGPLHARIPRRHHYRSARHSGSGDSQGVVPHPPREVQARGLVLDSAASGALARILPNLTYELQLNWPAAGATSARNPPTSAPSSKTPTSRGIRRARASSASLFGQFKVPFGRQQLTSSGNQQLRRSARSSPTNTRAAATPAWPSRARSATTSSSTGWRVQRQRPDARRSTTTPRCR